MNKTGSRQGHKNVSLEQSFGDKRLFYSGEIWLMRKLVKAKKLTQAKIAKMFKCNQSIISRYCKKMPNSDKYVRIFCRERYYYEQS